MRQIQLTQGKTVIVDDQDYEWLNKWKWYAKQSWYTFYATRLIRISKNERRHEWMHRLILGLCSDDRRQCDHRDGDGLNNRRSNLRVCLHAENGRNRRKRAAATSIYKGLYWNRRDRKWYSQIKLRGKLRHLGVFDSEIEAAKAYDRAATIYHRDFAFTNEMSGLING